MAGSLTSLRSLLKCHLLREVLPDSVTLTTPFLLFLQETNPKSTECFLLIWFVCAVSFTRASLCFIHIISQNLQWCLTYSRCSIKACDWSETLAPVSLLSKVLHHSSGSRGSSTAGKPQQTTLVLLSSGLCYFLYLACLSFTPPLIT